MKKNASRIFAWIMTMCICLTCLVFPDDVKAVCIAGNHSSIQRIDLPDTYEMEYVDENGGYHYGGAAGHLVIRHQKLVCSECEEVIDEDRTSLKDYSEAHDPDENGVCKKCGYVRQVAPACSHDEKKPGSYIRSDDPELDPNDNSQHIIRNYYAVVCSNCGEALEGEMEGEPTYAPHTFNGEGVCTACNYECTHPEESYVERSLGSDDPVPFDEEQHSITEYYRIKCGICGKTVTDEQEKVVYEDHNFDNNGTCSECGYAKAPNPEELKISLSVNPTTVEVGGQFIAVVTVTGGVGDVNYHWVVTCEGKEVRNTTVAGPATDLTAEEAGEYVFTVTVWDANGTQRTATATVTAIPPAECEHENTEPVYTDPEYEQIEGDEENHNVYRYYNVVCSDCGEIIETHKCDGPETEAHHFDANGTCSECGYVKAAPSDELRAFVDVARTTALVGEALEASATATGGDGNYKFAWKITRDDEEINTTDTSIGPKYSWPADEAGTYVFTVTVVDGEGTNATADGAPIVVTECQHEHTKDIELEAPIYTNNGDSGHTRTVKVRIECVDCGAVVVEETIVSRPEAHDFSNGPCPCGQSNHVHTYKENIISRTNYINQNQNQHTVTVTYVDKCDTCGDMSEEKTRIEWEKHNYSYKSEIIPGHQAGLGHLKVEYCICGATREQYITDDNCCECNGHTWSGYTDEGNYKKRYCLNCGLVEMYRPPKAEPKTVTVPYSGPVPESDYASELKDYRDRYTLFDSAMEDILGRKSEFVYNLAKAVYKGAHIIDTTYDLITSSEEEKLQDMALKLLRENFTTYLADQYIASYDEIDEKLDLLGFGNDLVTIKIPRSSLPKTGYQNLKGFWTIEAADGWSNTVGDVGWSVIFDGVEIVCDTIQEAKELTAMLMAFERADEYLKNINNYTVKNSVLRNACDQLQLEIKSQNPLDFAQGNALKDLGTNTLKYVVGVGFEALYLNKTLVTATENVLKYSRGGRIIRKPFFQREWRIITNGTMKSTLHSVAGTVMAWQAGALIGDALTYGTNKMIEDEDDLMRLYIINAEIDQARKSASGDDAASIDLTSLYLTTQEAGIRRASEYYKHYGMTWNMSLYKLINKDGYPSNDELDKWKFKQLEYLDEVIEQMGLPPQRVYGPQGAGHRF